MYCNLCNERSLFISQFAPNPVLSFISPGFTIQHRVPNSTMLCLWRLFGKSNEMKPDTHLQIIQMLTIIIMLFWFQFGIWKLWKWWERYKSVAEYPTILQWTNFHQLRSIWMRSWEQSTDVKHSEGCNFNSFTISTRLTHPRLKCTNPFHFVKVNQILAYIKSTWNPGKIQINRNKFRKIQKLTFQVSLPILSSAWIKYNNPKHLKFNENTSSELQNDINEKIN